MRRLWGFILLGLGLFLLVGAGLTRFYVFDRVLKTPIDQFAQTVAPGTGTYFDAGTQSERQADITATRRLVADVPASNDTVGVWNVGLVLQTGDGKLVNANTDRVAFDRKTGESVRCCGEAVDGKPTPHDGLSYKFPFFTKKQTYQFWDISSKKSFPIRYVSEESIQGLTTDKFIQEIGSQQIGVQAVPGSFVGESAPTFQSPIWYDNIRTVWVEPRTGIIIKGTEQIHTTLRDSKGNDKIVALQATLTFDDPTQHTQADLARKTLKQIDAVELWLPVGALVLGLLAVVGAALLLRSGGPPPAGQPGERLVPAGGPGAAEEMRPPPLPADQPVPSEVPHRPRQI